MNSIQNGDWLTNEGIRSFDIRTRTIDQTLSPILTQLGLLINRKAGFYHSDGSSKNLTEIVQNVQTAVFQFVSVSEKVANEHPHLKSHMQEASQQTRDAAEKILSSVNSANPTRDMVGPIRQIVNSICKVLVLADSVIIKEICQSKDRVMASLDVLTKVTNFSEFLNSFTNFGHEMAEFGKLTGERQSDTKKELDVAKMACLRGFLEKSTALYLICCKICLRHPTTSLAKDSRDSLVALMMKSLAELVDIVCYSASVDTEDHLTILSKSLSQYSDALEMCAILAGDSTAIAKAQETFSSVDEYVHDFTDSAFTPHEHREIIILSCQKCKEELDQLASIPTELTEKIESAIETCRLSVQNLQRQLIQHTVSGAAEVFGNSVDTGLLAALKSAAQEGEVETMENLSTQIREHVDLIQEICKQMQHVAPTDTFYIRVKYTSGFLLALTELLLQHAEVFGCHAMSKVAAEGYTSMADSWVILIGELAAAAEELQESLFQRS